MSDAPDDFRPAIKRQILDAYGFASEGELDAAIEAEFPGWLAAHAEYEAEQAAYRTSLDGIWNDYLQRMGGFWSAVITDDWLAIATAQVEQDALNSGQLRYGAPGDWFRSIKWSPAAWTALHGAKGPRGRTRQAL